MKIFICWNTTAGTWEKGPKTFDQIEDSRSLGTARVGRANSARAGPQTNYSWGNSETRKILRKKFRPGGRAKSARSGAQAQIQRRNSENSKKPRKNFRPVGRDAVSSTKTHNFFLFSSTLFQILHPTSSSSSHFLSLKTLTPILSFLTIYTRKFPHNF